MLKNNLQELLSSVVDLIYPIYCVICNKKVINKELSPICLECFRKIHWNLPPFCNICGRNISVELIPFNICLDCKKQNYFFDRAWSVSFYEGIIRECIHKFKYEHKIGLVYFFKKILVDFAKRFISLEKFDYLLPIPLHPLRLREREFDQALLLAQSVAKEFKKKIFVGNIYRKKYTIPQTDLSGEERRKNVKDAFGIKNKEKVIGENFLVIDDVFTTGSTINECAKLLKENGANIVEALTIAC